MRKFQGEACVSFVTEQFEDTEHIVTGIQHVFTSQRPLPTEVRVSVYVKDPRVKVKVLDDTGIEIGCRACDTRHFEGG